MPFDTIAVSAMTNYFHMRNDKQWKGRPRMTLPVKLYDDLAHARQGTLMSIQDLNKLVSFAGNRHAWRGPSPISVLASHVSYFPILRLLMNKYTSNTTISAIYHLHQVNTNGLTVLAMCVLRSTLLGARSAYLVSILLAVFFSRPSYPARGRRIMPAEFRAESGIFSD